MHDISGGLDVNRCCSVALTQWILLTFCADAATAVLTVFTPKKAAALWLGAAGSLIGSETRGTDHTRDTKEL